MNQEERQERVKAAVQAIERRALKLMVTRKPGSRASLIARRLLQLARIVGQAEGASR
jgi:hypothetical protein